jgi:mannose-6-phosphate isomerase-like protein (cupin superfamily)
MVVHLNGGVQVAELKEGTSRQEGDLRIWDRFKGDAVSMRVLQLDGRSTLRNDRGDEVLYVLEDDVGIHLPAGTELPLEGTLTLVAVSGGQPPPAVRTGEGACPPPQFVRLHHQPIQHTGDRWYRELIQSEITQFVGSIPPGRAPDHFHLYEEMLCILQGSGIVWSGDSTAPIGPGSCVYLPPRQAHCLENTGSGELRLLGVFYPAGSPAMRYAADVLSRS